MKELRVLPGLKLQDLRNFNRKTRRAAGEEEFLVSLMVQALEGIWQTVLRPKLPFLPPRSCRGRSLGQHT